MNFANPVWLPALFVLPVIWYLYHRSEAEKKQAALRFSSLALIPESGRGRRVKNVLFGLHLLLVASLVLALADPQLPLAQAHKGVNVVLALDVSGSMAAGDYKPTRLEAAKESATTLIRGLKARDNVGVVLFSDGATTAAYLTPDKDRVIEKLRAVKQTQGKTALGDGLALAVDMATSIPNRKRVVVLLSDGVNNAGVVNPGEAVEFARDNSIQVYTIGLGSREPVVLGYDLFGNPQYARLDEETLQWIASETGGRYFKSVDTGTLNEIYRRLPREIKREREDTSIKDWFILLALLALAGEFYLRFGRHRIIP